MTVLAFNGERGIALDRITNETVQFDASQVKRIDLLRITQGSSVLVTPEGYIEESVASFMRLYGDSHESSVNSGVSSVSSGIRGAGHL